MFKLNHKTARFIGKFILKNQMTKLLCSNTTEQPIFQGLTILVACQLVCDKCPCHFA
jgi:hypothetical protein